MGIRFLCPNGHKLNVKAFLAGKRGVCPDCGARFTIPQQSSGEAISATAKDTIPSFPAASIPVPGSPTDDADPIDAAPDAVWYVRPQAGGQYGPAASDLMRQWLDEGRVAADSLVWRDGWPDWKAAGEVFATLGNGHSDPPDHFDIQVAEESARPMATSPAAAGPRRRRGKSKSMVLWLLAAAVLLAILTIVLLVASG